MGRRRLSRTASTGAQGSILATHEHLVVMTKVIAIALAVGLDVLAISVGIGVMRLAADASVRLGCAFAGSEIAMQVVGYGLGSGAGKALGTSATYLGFFLLAAIAAG